MKAFAATLLIAAASAVKVKSDEYDYKYEVVPDSTYETDAAPESHYGFEAAPRYWDDHLHYKGPTWVDFTTTEPYVAKPVTYETPAYNPYIPKYENHYVPVESKHTYNDFGDLFKPYSFFEKPEEDKYGDPIYEPKHDKLHGKQDPVESEEDIHAHGADSGEKV